MRPPTDSPKPGVESVYTWAFQIADFGIKMVNEGEIPPSVHHSHGNKGILDAIVTAPLLAVNDLGDVADAPTSRTNLGLGDSATKDVGTGAGTVCAGDDARILTTIEHVDLTDGGVTTLHTHATPVGHLEASNNLSDVADVAASRTSLGLGNAAVADFGTGSGDATEGDDARLLTTVQLTDLTDGGPTTLHSHAIADYILASGDSMTGQLGLVKPTGNDNAVRMRDVGWVDHMEQAEDGEGWVKVVGGSGAGYLEKGRTYAFMEDSFGVLLATCSGGTAATDETMFYRRAWNMKWPSLVGGPHRYHFRASTNTTVSYSCLFGLHQDIALASYDPLAGTFPTNFIALEIESGNTNVRVRYNNSVLALLQDLDTGITTASHEKAWNWWTIEFNGANILIYHNGVLTNTISTASHKPTGDDRFLSPFIYNQGNGATNKGLLVDTVRYEPIVAEVLLPA